MPTIGTLPYPLGFTPPTSAHETLILRPERHFVSAHLTFSTDICASKPRSTPYAASSLRTCRLAVILSVSEESAKNSGLNFTHRYAKIKHRD